MICPSMDHLIEDFGKDTGQICLSCREKRRWNNLVKLEAPESELKWWLVCRYCDAPHKEDQ